MCGETGFVLGCAVLRVVLSLGGKLVSAMVITMMMGFGGTGVVLSGQIMDEIDEIVSIAELHGTRILHESVVELVTEPCNKRFKTNHGI